MSHNQRITVHPLTVSEQSALDQLVDQWRAKRPRNALRAGFYDMQNATNALKGRDVPETIRRREFVLGWSALSVDKLARRSNLEGFYDADGADLASLGLNELVDSNRLLSHFKEIGTSSLIHAVSWIITTQGDESAGEAPVLMLGRDALSGTGQWNTRRHALDSFLSIAELDDDGEPVEMTMYLHNLNVVMSKAGGRWSVDRRPHSFGVPVDPIRYRARLGRPFGSSRISRAVMSIHIQALAAMIRADVNGEAYSLPRYVLLGATEEAFRHADGSPKPTWQAAWDAVWAIGDDMDQQTDPQLARADVKQFTGQSPEPQNAHLRMLAQMFSGETSIPIGELGIIGDSNPTSYEALQASRDDIISEAESANDGWSPDLSRSVTRALAMLNGDVPEGLRVTPRWRSPMHLSRAAAADAGSKIVNTPGMQWLAETEVGLEIVGLTDDQIRRAMLGKRRAQGREVLEALRSAAGQVSDDDASEPAATEE